MFYRNSAATLTDLAVTVLLQVHPHGVGNDLWPLLLTQDAEDEDAGGGQHVSCDGEVEVGGVGSQDVCASLPHHVTSTQHLKHGGRGWGQRSS